MTWRFNIAYDAKRAFLNTSGLGNYARTLIKSLHHYYPENAYTLFTTKTGESEFYEYVQKQKNIRIEQPQRFLEKKISSYWRSYGITDILNEQRQNVYHGLSNELPFNIENFKGKKIVTIHDLIFLRYPELYSAIDSRIYNKKFRHACDVADVIIAISEETKRDIQSYYFVPAEKIKVIYQSCDEHYYQVPTPQTIQQVTEKYKLPQDFLLYVGTIEERKNLLTIVKALQQVPDIPLIVVGKKKKYFHTVLEYIRQHNLSGRVVFLKNVSNEELAVIYRLARIFIYPSVLEGFGIPILEALVSQVPVITTKDGCFPEAGGTNSLYINPADADELAEKIRFLLHSDDVRKDMAEKGLQYAQKFHPSVITKQLMEVYISS